MDAQAISKSQLEQQYQQAQQQEDDIKSKFKKRGSFQIHSVNSELKSSPASTSQLNNPHQFKLQGQLKALVNQEENYGEVIRLAYVSNEDVHIDQQSLYFLQKFSTYEISFIGFIGSLQTGKSLLIDIILNLSGAEGNQFTNTYRNKRQKGIYLWTIPFSSNNKSKTFLIQCSGINHSDINLEREDQILIDLVMILCSSLVCVNPPQAKDKKKNRIFQKTAEINALEINLINELANSSKRITKQGSPTSKFQTFWPQSIYSINTSNFLSNHTDQLSLLFSQTNFVNLGDPFLHEWATRQQLLLSFNNRMNGINPHFINSICEMFLEIMNRTITKQYQSLKYTGNICCKLLINTIKYLNKKPIIKINKVFNSIMKELYQSSYSYHTELYDGYLKDYFGNQQPLPFDELINAFKISSNYALDSFNEVVVNEQMHQQYENKMLGYIESKQILIIEINSKKTKNLLREKSKKVENIKQNDMASVMNMIRSLNGIESHLDHNRSYMIAEKLLKYSKNLEKRMIEKKLMAENDKIVELKQDKYQLQCQYNQIKNKNQQSKKINKDNEKKYQTLSKQIFKHQPTIKNYKKQIETQKKYQKEYIVTKQSKKEYAEDLLEKLRQYEEKIRENNKQMQEIQKDYQYHPDILLLNKKIEEKERENKELELELMQHRLDGGVSRNSVLSKISAVRSAVQKSKQTKPANQKQIKRLTTKK